jgi:SH3 domain-containing YSC84-like protein 1
MLLQCSMGHSKEREMNIRLNTILALTLFFTGFLELDVAANQDLEERLNLSRQTIEEMVDAPDGIVPSDLIRRSKAIVIFPSVIKAGLGFGAHYGRGVVLRRDASTGKWGPPAFITLLGASVGWQMGIQSTGLVLLIMNDVNLKNLFRDKFTIGADASVAAGPIGRDASAATDLGLSGAILSYSRAKGLFAGISFKGSVIESDWKANEAYYGSDLSIIDIFFKGRGGYSPEAERLVNVLNKYK